jgi:quercetin dioxygenase-like cupin family protein
MKIEKTANISESPVETDGAKDVTIRWLISKEDGAKNFAMRMFEVQPGGCTPLHRHPHEHEVFVVDGQAAVVCEGREYALEREHVVFVPPNEQHQFRNTGSTMVRFLCLIPMDAV